jgi:hypothetical protein
MAAEIQFVECAQCGASIDESPATDPANRAPCPACGSPSGAEGSLTQTGILLLDGLVAEAPHARERAIADGERVGARLANDRHVIAP